jgi:hypothetical protein
MGTREDQARRNRAALRRLFSIHGITFVLERVRARTTGEIGARLREQTELEATLAGLGR